MKQHQVIIDSNQCIGCGQCVRVCVANNLVINQQKATIKSKDCVMCGQCSAICPKKAISISGYDDEPVEKTKNVSLNPQEVLDTIRFRRSIRNFKQEAIPQEIIEQILEAGRLTHTAENAQDVSFVVLSKQKEAVEKRAVHLFRLIKPLADIVSPIAKNTAIDDHFFFFNAPLVIVILAKNKTNGILAAQNMEFVAEANGLGVLYSGFFTMAANASGKIKKAIQLPKGKKVAMTLVMGVPSVKYLRSTAHKELDVKYM